MRFIKITVIIMLWTLVGLFLLLMIGINAYHQTPEKTFSRMERQDPEEAQEIIDNYAEELKMIAAATDHMEENNLYFYTLNSSASRNREALDEMPRELVDALRQMERKFRGCSESLYLHSGQTGVLLTDDGGGFSLLCYPGGETFFDGTTRCLDMGDGWELQMYYAPKG